jgi:hypothetical protein
VPTKRKPGKSTKRKSAAAGPRTPVIVTVTDAMLTKIQNVADKLAAKGMKVERVMPMTGVIAGSSASAKMPALRDVEGVMSVEEELAAVLPPPDSPVR